MISRSSLGLFALVCASPALVQSQTFSEKVYYNFVEFDGAGVTGPAGPMMQASDGNFYVNVVTSKVGAILKVTPAGVVTELKDFCTNSSDCDESPAYNPAGALFQGSDGALYGTSKGGGTNGYGTVFKITLGGIITVLHSFCNQGDCADGQGGGNGVIQGTDGNLYGVVDGGGAYNAGAVYQLTSAGGYKILHNFCTSESGNNCNDGASPAGQLVEGSDGNFYGITPAQGAHKQGDIFRVTSAGGFTDLYDFCADQDCLGGGVPNPGLFQGANNLLFGTDTSFGKNNAGSAFSLSITSSDYAAIYSFCSATNSGGICTDGLTPSTSLFLAGDGNLYGATTGGGEGLATGVVYQLSQGGTEKAVYDFCQGESGSSCTDITQPQYALVQGSDGSLWGVSSTGGKNGTGGIFRVASSTPLKAPVQLSVSPATVQIGSSFSLTYAVLNAYSNTFKQCYRTSSDSQSTWTGKISSGPASAAVTLPAPTVAGTYSYSLTCGGVETSSATVTVTKANTATTVTAAPNPAITGQTVTATAVVKRSSSAGVPTGSVTFTVAGTAIGASPLNSSGVAMLSASTAGIPPGTYPLVASYTGDSEDLGSASAAVNVVIEPKTATTTSLAVSPTVVSEPATVTATATVKKTGATGAVSGTVTFFASGIQLGSGNVNSAGVAMLSLPTGGVPKGNYQVTATYNGDATDTGSTSPAVSVTLQ